MAVDVQRLVRDAMRYRAIKEKIDYSEGTDGMTWAHLEWCVNFRSLSPVDLDEAIDQILLANQPVWLEVVKRLRQEIRQEIRQELAELKEQLQDERDNRGDVISKF